MKHFLFILSIVFFTFPSLAQETVGKHDAADSVVYLSELGDVPLMPGLEQIDDSALLFDKPAGRFVEVSFTSPDSQEDILAFYGESLPPLGWRMTGPDSFERDSETLTLTLEESESGDQIVLFRLEPVETSEETAPKPEKTAP